MWHGKQNRTQSDDIEARSASLMPSNLGGSMGLLLPRNMYYIDSVLAMGHGNAAMACSRTTDAAVYMHQGNGYIRELRTIWMILSG